MIRPLLPVLAILLRSQAGTTLPGEDRFQADLARERVAAESALASGDRAKAAHHFYERGMLFCERDWYDAARTDLRSAVREAVAAEARKIELEARVALGLAERCAGFPAAALEEATTVLERLGPEDPPGLECAALYYAGDACFDLLQFEGALGYFERMLAKADSASREEDEAIAWAKIGLAHMNLGDAPSAEECHEKALRAAEAAGVAETLDRVQLFRAKRFQMLGRHEHSAELLEGLIGSKYPLLRLDALADLALGLVSLGRIEEGQQRFEEARALALELGLPTFEAKYFHFFGNLDADRGDLDEARRKLERARDLLQEPHRARELGELMLSLAGVLAAQDDPGAIDAYRQALAVSRQGDCDRSLESKASACIAGVYFSAGATDLARRHLLVARSTAELSDDLEPAAVAAGTLAWIEKTEGRFAAASSLARESFRLYRVLGMDWQSLEMLDTLAATSLASGDEASLQECVDLAGGIFDGDFLRASDLEECAPLRAQFAIWAEHQQALASLRLGRPDLEEPERARILAESFARAGEWKARALLGGLTQARKSPRTVERAAALAKRDEGERELFAIRSRISSAHRTGAPPDVVQSLMATAEAIRLESDELASGVRKEEAALGAALAPSATSLEQVRSALQDDRTVLIEYVAGAGRLQAYVLTRTSLELVDLGEREPIEQRVAELQHGLGLKKPASTSTILEQAGALYEELLGAPLRPFAKDRIDQIVVVPTSALSALPFEALIVPSAEKTERRADFAGADFLVRKYAVTYAPSAAVFVELAALAKRSGPSTVLMMVDPAYPAITDLAPVEPIGFSAAAGVNLMGRSFARLIASRDEGCFVARVLGGATDVSVDEFGSGGRHSISAKGYLLLGGAESTPARFLAEAPKHSVIHVAAHGLADFQDPEQGALALSPHGSSDGFLTYREVMRLPLHADLAVLSACDTGLGRQLAGEGILSLARAFMLAGSRTVVASLWPVDDRQTGETMGHFYRHYLAEGATIPRALRHAKLEVIAAPRSGTSDPRGVTPGTRKSSPGRLTESADPWFWAPFVCVGPVL